MLARIPFLLCTLLLLSFRSPQSCAFSFFLNAAPYGDQFSFAPKKKSEALEIQLTNQGFHLLPTFRN